MFKVSNRQAAARSARLTKAIADAKVVVATGQCPQCGCELKINLSLTGWWQCTQYGAEGFRKDPNKPKCSFQCFAS